MSAERTKFFEIRDRGTFIPAVGVSMNPDGVPEPERWLLRRAGFSADVPLILLARLGGGEAQYDPYSWNGRTMPQAHLFIQEHWNELNSGAVIDVEFVLGETTAPKRSEAEVDE